MLWEADPPPIPLPGSPLPVCGPAASDATAAAPLGAPRPPQMIAVCAVPFFTAPLGPGGPNQSRGGPTVDCGAKNTGVASDESRGLGSPITQHLGCLSAECFGGGPWNLRAEKPYYSHALCKHLDKKQNGFPDIWGPDGIWELSDVLSGGYFVLCRHSLMLFGDSRCVICCVYAGEESWKFPRLLSLYSFCFASYFWSVLWVPLPASSFPSARSCSFPSPLSLFGSGALPKRSPGQ